MLTGYRTDLSDRDIQRLLGKTFARWGAAPGAQEDSCISRCLSLGGGGNELGIAVQWGLTQSRCIRTSINPARGSQLSGILELISTRIFI